MAKLILVPILVSFLLHSCIAPPVTKEKSKDKAEEENEIGGLEDYMEYHRYLKEVVNALESDPEFRKKLEKADESDIRSGKIAEELEFVSHHVRNRLDEIKRVELNRLRDLTEKKMQLQQNIDLEDPTHRHLDHTNPHTFEIDDLKKLIAKTTEDLAEADRKRREEFKQYEMQKEFEKQLKLNHTNGAEREKLEREFKEREEKHKKHEKLHEPGHKAQLEEVWQEQDQMQQDFDPKTFFMLHDLDSNGLWDQDEVKALFIKELEKMYAAGEPEDDMKERAEEMERMRESVFKEVDLNRDGFIDFQEFLAQTKRNDFQQDHGWQGLDEQRPYTDEEMEEYIRRHQNNNEIPQQAYHQVHPGQVNNNGAYQQQQQQQAHYQQMPPQGGYQQPPNVVYQQHVQQPQPPQASFQQQQHPQGGFQQQQQPLPPQGGFQQPQPPQGSFQQQQPQAVQGGYQQPPQAGFQQQQQQPQHPQGYQQQQQPSQVQYQQQPSIQQHPNQPQPQVNKV